MISAPDEATLDIGVNLAGRLDGGGTGRDGSGPALFVADGEERDQAEQPVGLLDHAVQG